MALYQFLIAVRPDATGSYTLTNDVGEDTRYCFIFILLNFSILIGLAAAI